MPQESIASDGELYARPALCKAHLLDRSFEGGGRLHIRLAEVSEIVGANEGFRGASHTTDVVVSSSKVVLVHPPNATEAGVEVWGHWTRLQDANVSRQQSVEDAHVLLRATLELAESQGHEVSEGMHTLVSASTTGEVALLSGLNEARAQQRREEFVLHRVGLFRRLPCHPVVPGANVSQPQEEVRALRSSPIQCSLWLRHASSS
mmetsp:Transcript_67272/g.161252  ORF Transcript_67272/g.161252 Transcript_67272/m.161252 type:complete len:205 (+) Transcript_67272:327-941(+)